jgi:hypothetical protein
MNRHAIDGARRVPYLSRRLNGQTSRAAVKSLPMKNDHQGKDGNSNDEKPRQPVRNRYEHGQTSRSAFGSVFNNPSLNRIRTPLLDHAAEIDRCFAKSLSAIPHQLPL